MNNQCVYFHINPLENNVFYVGIGNEKRPYIKTSRNIHWRNKVKIHGFIVDVVETNLSLEEAKEREKFYINKIGRKDLGKGNLVNLTSGGQGSLGRTHFFKGHSEDALKIMSESRKLNNPGGFKKGHKKSVGNWKNKKHTPETIEKMRNTALNMSEEHRKKLSDKAKQRKNKKF